MTRQMFAVALAACLLAGCAAKAAKKLSLDIVNLQNASGYQNGLLVSGMKAGGLQVDYERTPHPSTKTALTVGKFAAGGNGEVVAFTELRPVGVLTPANWTNSADSFNLRFGNKITIGLKIWIVYGPFAAQRSKALSAVAATVTRWNNERMGVEFSSVQIADATANPNASSYYAFNCTQRSNLQRDIGADAGMVNAYFVDTVNGSANGGEACNFGGSFVSLGSAASDDLLAHETGHTFNLRHVDTMPLFDQSNIMFSWPALPRRFLTEGQLFRAHLDPNSTLNNLYPARPQLPVRDCSLAPPNQCPPLSKRIWKEGSFKPN
jgi:hypothetical protein